MSNTPRNEPPDRTSAWLAELPELEPSAALRRRIASIPLEQGEQSENEQNEQGFWSSLGFLTAWRAAVLAAGLLALGGLSGWLAPDPFEALRDVESEPSSAEWEELTELALATDFSEVGFVENGE